MSEYKRILTVQDISCVGQCSLTVALPILSACGVDTAVLPSSVLSTHTGCFPTKQAVILGRTALNFSEQRGDATAAALAETLAVLVNRSSREHGGVPVSSWATG